MRVGVLASGSGTNLQALLDAPDAAYEIALVASDKREAGALDRAANAQIPTLHLEDPSDGTLVAECLAAHNLEVVVLAGYLKLLPPEVLARFPDRIINIHPALLPAFGGKNMYGMRVHRAVLKSGVNVSGVTVHLIDEDYDRGSILAQWPVPVRADDSAEDLQKRVLQVEHLLLPEVVNWAARHGRPVPMRPLERAFLAGDEPSIHFTVANNQGRSIADASRIDFGI
jgi:phosphoribosylglycinamide formyltransferase 1